MRQYKQSVIKDLKQQYDEIVHKEFNHNYLSALEQFERISEEKLRAVLNRHYKDQRSRDQAWKTCKGELYEYAVFRFINQAIDSEGLTNIAVINKKDIMRYKQSIVIRNWSEIFPDVDMLIVKGNEVKAIVSCKTSLRERLTETAFWKRELERHERTKNVKLLFITTNKDDELQQDVNRYIVQHVLDYTFVTDPEKYTNLVNYYSRRFNTREDLNELLLKVRRINDFIAFLKELS